MLLKRTLYIALVFASAFCTVVVPQLAWTEEEQKKADPSISQTEPTADTATIIGTVKFEGDAPFRRAINFGANLDCKRLHDGKVHYEHIVINQNDTLKDTLVYVRGKPKSDHKPSSKPVVVDQVGCIFIPHVSAVMVGQPMEFLNSDPALHNIRTESKKQRPFNISQPNKGMKYTHQFEAAEIGIPLRCDVHHWMVAYAHVLSHPFFAVTGEKGTFKIQGLAPRTYNIEAWHAKLGTQRQKITLEAGETKTVEFVFTDEE